MRIQDRHHPLYIKHARDRRAGVDSTPRKRRARDRATVDRATRTMSISRPALEGPLAFALGVSVLGCGFVLGARAAAMTLEYAVGRAGDAGTRARERAATALDSTSTTGKNLVVYMTTGGTSERFARALATGAAKATGERWTTMDGGDVDDPENTLGGERGITTVVFVVSTDTGGAAPKRGAWLARWARETAYDERAGWMYLKNLRYAVFGCGNREYGDDFNRVGRALDAHLARMGAERLVRRRDGDEATGRMEAQFEDWAEKVVKRLASSSRASDVVAKGGLFEESTSTDDVEGGCGSQDEDALSIAGSEDGQDMEDIGENEGGEPKEMVTPALRGALTKQGYKILGSHSGVKICRWTKAMLRGRGGCYKHTFYGIESHRCMETTPSLACANKCTFCWRHHTNPVGKSWRWKMDEPLELVEQAISEHCKMVKQMKGVPGVLPEKLAEGMEPKHCALSLVGEPIMYPEIAKFVSELHSRKISTFLVTNAQFPEAIVDLPPITQLYVSVDAATPETLKAVDRPLFADYWDRFVNSLKSLKMKQQRTVYRLTLVAGYNMEDIAEYAKLIDLGQPDFIEIKGVTFCGSSDTSSLTMKNVPYHKDVCKFGEAIVDMRRRENGEEEYGLACEHAHSCCILLARTDKYKIDNEWYTWINYDKFQHLVVKGEKFTAADYIERTPKWATYGAVEAGFDPEQTRHIKIRNHPGKDKTAPLIQGEA